MATRRRAASRARLRSLAAGGACLALVSACGSRVSDERVVQAASGGESTVVTTSAPAAAGTGTGTTVPPDGTAATGTAAPRGGAEVVAPQTGNVGTGQQGTDAGTDVAAEQKPSSDDSSTPAAGSNGPGGAAVAAKGCTKAGPPIVLGQVVSASGIIGANVGSALPVLGAWAKYINDNGGIACHRVNLFSQDDASDPGKASSAVQDLVKNRKAIGLVANFIPLSISGFKSALNSVKVPAIGGDLFSTTWWSDPLFYPVGTHVDANAVGSTLSLVKGGFDKVAVIYCIEAAVCPPYKDAIKQNASGNGYEVVYDVQVSITAPDYTTQCQSAKDAGAEQINMIVEGSGVSRIALSCARIGYFPRFAVASLGATFDINDKNVQKMSPTIASAANDWFTAGSAGQKEFQDAMKRYAPTLELDPTAPLAWADGMMVKAAIEKLGAAAEGVEITAEMLRKGLSMIKNETLDDMIRPTSFSPSQGVNPKTPCFYSMIFSAPGAPVGRWQKASNGCLKGLSANVTGGVASGEPADTDRGLAQGSLALAALAGLPLVSRRSRWRA